MHNVKPVGCNVRGAPTVIDYGIGAGAKPVGHCESTS